MHALYDLSGAGLLRISGPDAKKLLQGQLTCDLDEVSPQQGAMGAHCNPQGRVISFFYLLMLADAYYLLLPREMVTLASAALKKFSVFYKVNLEDVSDALTVAGFQTDSNLVNTENMARLNLPNQRFILLGSVAEMKTFCDKRLQTNFDLLRAEAWHARNIEEKIPAVYAATSSKFLPHEINLPALNAVNFNKGCYTGQEIIARMHYRGKLKTHLFKAMLTTDHLPAPGSLIYASQDNPSRPVGTVVDTCQTGYNNYLVLLITDEMNAKDKHLFLHKNDNYFTF